MCGILSVYACTCAVYMYSVYVTRFCGRDIVCVDVNFVCMYMYNVLYTQCTQCTQCKCTYQTIQIVQVLYIVHCISMPYTVNNNYYGSSL